MNGRSPYLDPDRVALQVPSPPKDVREWIDAPTTIAGTISEAATFARISLNNLEGEGTDVAEDPVRAANRLDVIAGRLAYTADRIRQQAEATP